jgi:hypothetical protein
MAAHQSPGPGTLLHENQQLPKPASSKLQKLRVLHYSLTWQVVRTMLQHQDLRPATVLYSYLQKSGAQQQALVEQGQRSLNHPLTPAALQAPGLLPPVPWVGTQLRMQASPAHLPACLQLQGQSWSSRRSGVAWWPAKSCCRQRRPARPHSTPLTSHSSKPLCKCHVHIPT